jgi:crotonobetainyl-CoA:carnitine CoA-transferase CaiB-like acyl-CoA transferase
VLYRLLALADVFVTNFPLPVRERLKVAADVLPLNPRLIYASLTAYGERGEEAASATALYAAIVGQHNEEVLEEAGYSSGDIGRLRSLDVLG